MPRPHADVIMLYYNTLPFVILLEGLFSLSLEFPISMSLISAELKTGSKSSKRISSLPVMRLETGTCGKKK